MNFDFSDEQNQLRDQARRLLAEGRQRARLQLNGDRSMDQELWKQIVEMGWPAASIDEECGGLGLSELALCVLAEEIGRSLAPVPFSSSVLHASTALKRIEACDLTQDLRVQLASGDKTATLALLERGQRLDAMMPTARVENGRISGSKSMVADAASANYYILSAISHEDGETFGWYCVDASAEGVTKTSVECIDRLRPHSDVHFQNVECARLGQPGQGKHYNESALNAIAVLTAFEQLGSAEAALEMSLEYVKSRLAFNRVVASYQAIKHRLADMYVKNQLARSHCYYGAWALTQSPAALPRAAAGARLAASDALNFAAEEGVELHGGIGFTWEGDIQLYYRRARLLAAQWGGRDYWARQLAQALRSERANAATAH